MFYFPFLSPHSNLVCGLRECSLMSVSSFKTNKIENAETGALTTSRGEHCVTIVESHSAIALCLDRGRSRCEFLDAQSTAVIEAARDEAATDREERVDFSVCCRVDVSLVFVNS